RLLEIALQKREGATATLVRVQSDRLQDFLARRARLAAHTLRKIVERGSADATCDGPAPNYCLRFQCCRSRRPSSWRCAHDSHSNSFILNRSMCQWEPADPRFKINKPTSPEIAIFGQSQPSGSVTGICCRRGLEAAGLHRRP